MKKSTVWKRNGNVVLELLSNKRKTTIPPSKHRVTGKEYKWLGAELGALELPLLPANFIEDMNQLFPAPIIVRKVYDSPLLEQEISFDEVEKMLGYISADINYSDWIAIGMAIKDEFGDAGFILWDKWSARSNKYKAAEMHGKWRSFSAGGYTIGTLVHFAKNGGWRARN